MKDWIKFLIIGWSIVSLGILIVSFQIMKEDFIQEDYEIMMIYKTPEKIAPTENFPHEWEAVAENLFYGKDIFDNIAITKKQFVERMKKAKGVTITSKNRIKNRSVYTFLPVYAFGIWALPIIVFSLIGIVFTQKDGQ